MSLITGGKWSVKELVNEKTVIDWLELASI